MLFDFLEESRAGKQKVVQLEPVSHYRNSLQLDEFVKRAGASGDAQLLRPFLEEYLNSVIRLNDPRYIGHQVARPHFASAIADLVNGLTNNGMAVYEMGPGPVTVEKYVIEWLLQFIPEASWSNANGFLTHGGSIANLTALLAARGVTDPSSWESGVDQSLAFLIPDSSHYCLKRAICILGYGEQSIVYLPTNSVGQIIPESVQPSYEHAIAKGKKPVVICANAGSTPTGLYDDLERIGEFADSNDLWFHVDGAHGASALVSERHRDLLSGIEYADSITWDQHKLMQTSALCTAVLFRESESINAIFQQNAPYLNQGWDQDFPNLFRQTVECTKVPMGLKFFLCLLAVGSKGMGSFVDQLFDQTQRIHDLIESTDGFSCVCQPQSNILCFQYRPEQNDAFEIRDQIVNQGDFYLTQTELAGQKCFRFTVTSPETDEVIVKQLLDRIEKTALAIG